MEKSLSVTLSSSIFRLRLTVQRVGLRFRLALARMRSPAPSRLLLSLLAGYGVSALALPTGGQVAAGGVTIAAPQNGSMNITQTTDKGIINWQSFNVGSGEKVNFLQPGATSSTLNRVVGNDVSSIFGQINANGQVFLLNSNGVLFAPGSQVNAAGLVASTMQLQDSQYLSGSFSLAGGDTGLVDNQGALRAGFVVLAGAQVSNTGSIVADGGTAALAAGSRVTMNLTGSDVVSVSVDAPTAAALVRSGGIVRADGGQVLISAKAADALLNTVVNVDGVVQAHSIGTRNGVIVLDGGTSGVVDVSGKLDASGYAAGQTGGTVKVLGANVGLFDGASIDASGDAGGGKVRLGGDWHGAGADGDANASQAIVDYGTSISANAVTRGNGGDVVVWSEDRSQVLGPISAHGGALAGNGGAVETSSRRVLQDDGDVDVSAAHGSGGSWLLDPDDIEIANVAINTNIAPGTFESSDSNAIVSATRLGTALGNGAVVNVVTESAGTDASNHGDITVTGDVTANLGNGNSATLNLIAQRNIVFANGSSISAGTNNRSLDVNLNAGTDVGGSNVAGTNVSAILMDANASIDTGTSGNFSATSRSATLTPTTMVLGRLNVGGTVTLASNGGAISQVARLVAGGVVTADAAGGTIDLLTTGNVINEFAVPTASANRNTVRVGTSGSLILDNVTATSLLTATGAASSVTQRAGDALNVTGQAQFGAGTGGATIGEAGNVIGTWSANTNGPVSFASSAAGGIALGAMNAASLAVDTTGGNGAVNGTGALIVHGAVAIRSGSGAVTLDNASNRLDSFGATTTGAVSVTDGLGLALDDVTAATLAVTTNVAGSNAAITQSNATTLSVGDLTVAAGTGAVTLDKANAVSGVFSGNGGAITLDTTGAQVLGNVNAASLTLAAGGQVSQSAGTSVTGGTIVAASTTAGDVLFTEAGNAISRFGASSTTAGAVVTLNDTSGVALADIRGGTLNVTAGGDVTQRAATTVVVNGVTTVTAAGHGVQLANSGNTIAEAALNGAVVSVGTSGSLILDNVTATSLLTATGAASSVTQRAGDALNVTGQAQFGAGTGGATIGEAGNVIGTWSANTNGPVSFASSAAGGIALGAMNAASLAVDTTGGNGAVNGTGALIVHGAVAIRSGSGAVTLDNASNRLDSFGATTTGAVSVTDGLGLALDDVTAATLAVTTNVAGSNAAITQSNATTLSVGDLTVAAGTGAVTLDKANAVSGVFSGNGGAITLDTTGAQVLGNVNAASLTLAAGGQVSQSAGTSVTGGTIVAASTTAGDVLFTEAGNAISRFGASSTTAGAVVTLNDTSGVALADIRGGTLNVTAGGDVTQRAATTVVVNGVTTVTAAGHGVQLANSGNTIAEAALNGAVVSVSTSGSLVLDDVTATDLTTATGSAGSVTQAPGDTLTVSGATHFGAGSGGVAITASGNTIGSYGANTSGAAIFTSDAGGVVLGDVTAASLAVDSHVVNGPVSQLVGTTLHVAGATAVDAGAGDVTLAATGNALGSFGATGGAVAVTDGSGLALDAVTASQLDVVTNVANSNGAITQNGALVVGGAGTTLNAGSGAITLTDAANVLGTLTSTGGTTQLTNAGALVLGNVTASGLTIATQAANGSVTQAAGTTVTATGATSVSTGNGAVALTNANHISNFSASSGADVSLATGTPLQLGNIVAANFTADTSAANGAITQAAGTGVNLAGTGSFLAGSGAVTLTGVANHLAGFSATGGTVTLNDASAVALGNVGAAQLTVDTSAANGDISQVAGTALTVSGAATFGAGAGNITLGQANDLAAFALAAPTTGAVLVNNTNALQLGNLGVGQLTVSTVGAITQTAGTALNVAGTSALTATGGDVILSNAGNDFGGAVTVAGNSVALTDVNDLTVASLTTGLNGSVALVAGGALITPFVDIDTGTGNLTLSSGGVLVTGTLKGADVSITGLGGVSIANDIDASGNLAVATDGAHAITQAAASTLSVQGGTTMNAGSGDVTLASAGNDFVGALTVTGGAVTVNAAGPVTAHLAAGAAASLVSGGALVVDGSSGGDLTADGASVSLGATHVAGNLNSVANAGNLVQTGDLFVGGSAVLDATGNVLLVDANNQFTSAVTATGASIALKDRDALTVHAVSTGATTLNAVGALAVDGNVGGALSAAGSGIVFGAAGTHAGSLVATSGGAITEQAGVSVAGASTLAAGANAVTLGGANDFGGLVTVTGGNVTLADTNALAVAGSSTGAFVATANGIAFGTTTVGSTLTVNSTGAVTQSGALHVGGASTLNSGASTLVLDNAGNSFGGVISVAGAAIDVEQAAAMTVHLNNAGSAVLVSGAGMTVDGTTTGDLAASGTSVVFAAPTQVGGNLFAAASGGTITQAGDLAVTGTSVLGAGAQDVTLDRAGNAFGGAVSATGANVALASGGALGAHLAASGGATLSAADALTVDGTTGGDLALAGNSVNFGDGATAVGGSLQVTTSGAPLATALSAGAKPLAAAAGGIAQTGTLAVGGTTALNAGGGDIDLSNTDNALAGDVTANGHAVNVASADAMNAVVTATGDATFTSAQDLVVQGTVAGGLTATGANVLIGHGTLAQNLALGGALNATATAGDVTLGFVSASGANVSATGDVLLDGTLASSENVAIVGASIRGLDSQGALDVAPGKTIALTATAGDIGRTPGSIPNLPDPVGIITLLNGTGQEGGVITVAFPAGNSGWFGVSSRTQFQGLFIDEDGSLNSSTFGCDATACFNVLGQTTAFADSVIANILNAASQDAADSAFGTENLDFAIRRGYLTTIGRVPPGIDEIAGDLGSAACDPRVTSEGTIKSIGACEVEAARARPKSTPLGGVETPTN